MGAKVEIVEAREADKHVNDRAFAGPLFIVGRPRSGTKLLRTLLNENPAVAIPISETNFIPQMLAKFGDPPRLAETTELDAFYDWFSSTRFYQWRQSFGIVLTKAEFASLANLRSWPSIIETILRFYAPDGSATTAIWGDKSPSYLTEMPLLKRLFPQARFLHIIRDPRDHCVSVKKAWGKSVLRSAAVWSREVDEARRAGAALQPDYQEVTFEGLLSSPEETLTHICTFLGIAFDARMLRPTVSHEDRGKAAGALEIVSHNQGKYKAVLPQRRIRRIEEIVFPVATALGYQIELAGGPRPLSARTETMLRVLDGVGLTRVYAREHGIGASIRHALHRAQRP